MDCSRFLNLDSKSVALAFFFSCWDLSKSPTVARRALFRFIVVFFFSDFPGICNESDEVGSILVYIESVMFPTWRTCASPTALLSMSPSSVMSFGFRSQMENLVVEMIWLRVPQRWISIPMT